MKNLETLIITDHGDPSVGIFPTSWEIQCPFYQEDMDRETLDFFRDQIIKIYQEFSEGKISADYESDLKEDNL